MKLSRNVVACAFRKCSSEVEKRYGEWLRGKTGLIDETSESVELTISLRWRTCCGTLKGESLLSFLLGLHLYPDPRYSTASKDRMPPL